MDKTRGVPADGAAPAESGDVTPEMAAGLHALLRLEDEREWMFKRTLGFGVRNSPVRTALMRHLLLAALNGHRLSVAECHRLCQDYGSRSTVRAELEMLAATGCVVVVKATGRRDAAVLPTKRLADFYREMVPAIRAELERSLGVKTENVKDSFTRR